MFLFFFGNGVYVFIYLFICFLREGGGKGCRDVMGRMYIVRTSLLATDVGFDGSAGV